MTAQDRRRWWALGALAVSVLAVGLDLTVLNLALPALAGSLHAGTGELQWFIAAYSLVLAAALLPAGLAGDRLGRRKVLTGALALFGAASLACAYASSAGELIAARAVLGLAAAAILPLSLAVIPVMFTPAEQPRAIALLGGMIFLGYPVGPILGGWLLDHFWWGSVFLVNVPVAVIAVVAVAVLMPESRSEQRPRLDLAGILVSAVGLSALTYGVIKAGQDGWGDPAAVATMAAGAVATGVFVRLELRLGRAGRQPLADLTLFRSARFGWGTALATLVSFTLFGVLFGIPLYFRDVRGLDSLGSGLRLVPLMVGIGVGLVAGQKLQSPGRGGAAPRVSVRALVTAGLVIMAAGLAAGAETTVTSGAGFTVAWLAATGLGLGLALPAMLGAALSELTPERSGSGSALITASRQVGATLGVAGWARCSSRCTGTAWCSRTGCRPPGPRPCAAACPAGSRWHTRWGRMSCWLRSVPRTPPGWTRCCGAVPVSRCCPRWRRWCSCRGGPGTRRRMRASGGRGRAGGGGRSFCSAGGCCAGRMMG